MARIIQIGVDVGGTFTDLVLYDAGRRLLFTGKLLTTPDDASRAIIEGIRTILARAGVGAEAVDGVIHGTTLVANTLIERKGATVGLITTAGFRDTLEIGNEIRYDVYDLFIEKPRPLVPRRLRREVAERIDQTGSVVVPLDLAQGMAVAGELVAAGVRSIAVCFLHAHHNAAHEQALGEALRAAFPDVPVSLSAEIAPEMREFERTSTVCANAYVRPLVSRYLDSLQGRLEADGMGGRLHVMLSNGGIGTVDSAKAHPVQLVESGPAAGAIAAAHYARLLGADRLIAFDMGGTTAKMCLVTDGQPDYATSFEAARVKRFRKGSGLPLKVPVIDLIEIGAGGGSIAWTDAMGLLKVGPESAGSVPGPVCYGRGGTDPTVTDADLLLGYLSPDFFLGGEMRLRMAEAHRAMAALGERVGLSALRVAAGIHAIVNENMAAATQMHLAEKGRDPRQYAMVAFGGAGPVHACNLARLLKLRRVVCPLGAGVMSALGFLVAAPAVNHVRSHRARLDRADWGRVRALFDDMENQARATLAGMGVAADAVAITRSADMRHVGQGFEIRVPIPLGRLDEASMPAIDAAFRSEYQALFERALPAAGAEALAWRIAASGPIPTIALEFEARRNGGSVARKGSRMVHFDAAAPVETPVFDRYALPPGTRFAGPALIEERESTVVAGPGCTVAIDESHNVVIDIGA